MSIDQQDLQLFLPVHSKVEQQALEDLDKAHKDMSARVKRAQEEATNLAGGQALMQSRLLQQELSEQCTQVISSKLQPGLDLQEGHENLTVLG